MFYFHLRVGTWNIGRLDDPLMFVWQFVIVQLLNCVHLFAAPWTASCQAFLSFTIFWSLLKLMSIELVMPSNHLILWVPFSSCLQSFPASGSFPMSQLFTWGGQSTGVSALASFFQRNPRPDLLQNGLVGSPCSPRDLKSLLQHHSSKASVLRCSAYFVVQLSHPYMTTGKTIALTIWAFVGKVISLLFNMLSRLVIAFPPRSQCLLISMLQSPSVVILEPKNIVSHCFHCFPTHWPWSDGTRFHDLHFLNVEF